MICCDAAGFNSYYSSGTLSDILTKQICPVSLVPWGWCVLSQRFFMGLIFWTICSILGIPQIDEMALFCFFSFQVKEALDYLSFLQPKSAEGFLKAIQVFYCFFDQWWYSRYTSLWLSIVWNTNNSKANDNNYYNNHNNNSNNNNNDFLQRKGSKDRIWNKNNGWYLKMII